MKLYVLHSGTGSLLLDRVFLHLPAHTRGLWDSGWSISVTVWTKSRTSQGRSWEGFLVISTVPSFSTSNPFIFLASHVFRFHDRFLNNWVGCCLCRLAHCETTRLTTRLNPAQDLPPHSVYFLFRIARMGSQWSFWVLVVILSWMLCFLVPRQICSS